MRETRSAVGLPVSGSGGGGFFFLSVPKVLEALVAHRYFRRLVSFQRPIKIPVVKESLTDIYVELDSVIIEVTTVVTERKMLQVKKFFTNLVNPKKKRVIVFSPSDVPVQYRKELELMGVRVATTFEELDALVGD